MFVALSGCAGTNFARLGPDRIILGKTSRKDIYHKMGQPYMTGILDKNDAKIQKLSYAFSTVSSEVLYKGVTPARGQNFYFVDDILVGTDFYSSFKIDGTDFDEKKVKIIKKGKSTKTDVIQLFGSIYGEYIHPLVSEKENHALVYKYTHVKGSAFNLRIYNKELVVTYNKSGVVTDVQYVENGTRD